MRDPRRTAGSASALMIGTAVVALFTTFGASIKASVDEMVNEDFGGDLVIESDDFSGAGLSPAVADEVAELPEVAVSAGHGGRHDRRRRRRDRPGRRRPGRSGIR